MEVTTLLVRLLMLEFILLETQVQDSYTQKSDADFLRITPNKLQHFQLDSVSFDCVGFDGSTQLRMIKNTKESDPACVMKRTSTGSLCTIERVYPGDSGEYWCETKGGERSNSINITVTAGPLILDSPVLPVMEGNNVTLRCTKETASSNLTADFYKDGLLVGSSSTGEMIIHSVSKSDEGVYKCNISDVGESTESWLAVRAPHRETRPSSGHFSYVLLLLRTVFIIMMVALLLLLLGLLHFGKLPVILK